MRKPVYRPAKARRYTGLFLEHGRRKHSKAIRPANAHKSLQACQHHIILRTGAVDDKRIAVAVFADEHAYMGIAGVKHQITRLCFAP